MGGEEPTGGMARLCSLRPGGGGMGWRAEVPDVELAQEVEVVGDAVLHALRQGHSPGPAHNMSVHQDTPT